MFKHVVEAKHINGFKVWLAFNDGLKGEIDLEEKINKKSGIFKPLHDVSYFKEFKITNDTLSWDNGADIAPESLYELLER